MQISTLKGFVVRTQGSLFGFNRLLDHKINMFLHFYSFNRYTVRAHLTPDGGSKIPNHLFMKSGLTLRNGCKMACCNRAQITRGEKSHYK